MSGVIWPRIPLACGPDNIQPRILKTCADQLSPIYTRLFNQCHAVHHSKTPDHWIEKNRPKEIAAFQLALPDDVLMQFDNCMDRMSVDEAKSPWVYQEKLKELFTGQDNIMPQRLEFLNCIQKPHESEKYVMTRWRIPYRN